MYATRANFFRNLAITPPNEGVGIRGTCFVKNDNVKDVGRGGVPLVGLQLPPKIVVKGSRIWDAERQSCSDLDNQIRYKIEPFLLKVKRFATGSFLQRIEGVRHSLRIYKAQIVFRLGWTAQGYPDGRDDESLMKEVPMSFDAFNEFLEIATAKMNLPVAREYLALEERHSRKHGELRYLLNSTYTEELWRKEGKFIPRDKMARINALNAELEELAKKMDEQSILVIEAWKEETATP